MVFPLTPILFLFVPHGVSSPRKNKLRGGANTLCWNHGLAAGDFVGNCRDNRGGFAQEQIQAAQIQLATGYSLRLHICQPFDPAKYDGISGAAGRKAPNRGKDEITNTALAIVELTG